MIKSLIIVIILKIIFILSLPSYEVNPKEPVMLNLTVGQSIPLVVTINETLTESLTVTCFQNIGFKYEGKDTINKLTKGKIIFDEGDPADKSQTLDCYPELDIINQTIVLVVNDKTTNKKIQFVPKYVVKPKNTNSRPLNKSETISLAIKLYEQNKIKIKIFDNTFLLTKESKEIKLRNCGYINTANKGETLDIKCSIDSEIDEGTYKLQRSADGKIEGLTPIVSGEIIFSKSNSKYLNMFLIYIINTFIFMNKQMKVDFY